MVIASRKHEVEGSKFLKKIKIEGKMNEGREVIVRRATVKWEGIKSVIVLWNKVYEQI